MKCRHCQTELTLEFLDLGHAPPSNAYLNHDDALMELWSTALLSCGIIS